jgi:anti-sigma regulatory factor (Ser/Thr protein kinase)
MNEAPELLPSAGRLMGSLRDIGYDVSAAIADLVDNSIDACAHRIDVEIVADRDGSRVHVIDDGLGMTDRALDEAMRFGTRRTYGDRDLGAYGLGLKTASLSQARRVTVATRSTARGPLRVRRWDLDHVVATDRWILERPGARVLPAAVRGAMVGRRGTAVVWEELDRIVGRPASTQTRRILDAVTARTAEHLAMVFHRFISGDAGGTPVTISVNGTTLSAWDPFARDQPATRALAEQDLELEHGGMTHLVTVRPHVLPAQHQFTTTEAHAAAAGVNRWNRQQGLYIYRRERLIQSGGWARLRTTDEHSKLARIALDIPAGAEEAFGISVTKMRVGLPEELRAPLRAIIAGVVAIAQDRYRQNGDRAAIEGPRSRRAPKPTDSDGWSLGGDWPHIAAVLRRELEGNQALLDRVMVSLVNHRRQQPASDGDSTRAELLADIA